MSEKQLPVAMERVRSQFEQWRAHKERGDRIPERLWAAATQAARQHGVNAVSRVARLEHSALRRRVEQTVGRDAGALEFVELHGVAPQESAGCVIEMEKSNGARMRICVHDGATIDWARMKEAFLGA